MPPLPDVQYRSQHSPLLKGPAMTRLDQHVALVRNKLAFSRFLNAAAWASLAVAGVVCAAILVDRLFRFHLPHPAYWLYGCLGAAVVASIVYAVLKRPHAQDAAVAIDLKLGLKEKFSTAIYARGNPDPFAQAAVRDAEATANTVSLHKR